MKMLQRFRMCTFWLISRTILSNIRMKSLSKRFRIFRPSMICAILTPSWLILKTKWPLNSQTLVRTVRDRFKETQLKKLAGNTTILLLLTISNTKVGTQSRINQNWSISYSCQKKFWEIMRNRAFSLILRLKTLNKRLLRLKRMKTICKLWKTARSSL